MKQDLNNGLGDILKALRRTQRLTQAEVGKLAGLERTSITNIENGNQILTVKTINAIAKALGYEVMVTFRPLKNNRERAVEIVSKWPKWKQEIALTAYSIANPPIDEFIEQNLKGTPQSPTSGELK